MRDLLCSSQVHRVPEADGDPGPSIPAQEDRVTLRAVPGMPSGHLLPREGDAADRKEAMTAGFFLWKNKRTRDPVKPLWDSDQEAAS